MWGELCCCLSEFLYYSYCRKSTGQEFFVPTRTLIAVKLLSESNTVNMMKLMILAKIRTFLQPTCSECMVLDSLSSKEGFKSSLLPLVPTQWNKPGGTDRFTQLPAQPGVIRHSVCPYMPADKVFSGKWHMPNRFGKLFFRIMNPRES